MHQWRIAFGSAKEVDTHLRLLAEANAVDLARATTALRLFDEVRAMTWRLTAPEAMSDASPVDRSNRPGGGFSIFNF